MTYMKSLRFLITCAIWFCTFTYASAPGLFPYQQVRLLDSPFKQAQELDLAYLMAMDADRLLAPFLREAGLKTKVDSYGNWENSGLDGHIGGHYLSALALAYASTGDDIYQLRLEYMLSELQKVQQANGNGYIGGVPDSKALWQDIARGEIDADLFSLNDHWVPLYNLHKTFAGLRDAYVIGGSDAALDLLKGLGTWAITLTKNLTPDQIQQLLYSEHGGMNEVFADYYAITGDKKYLQLAVAFSDERILKPLLAAEDNLNGLHANTQIPKVVGFARIAQLNGNTQWQKAAEYFWNNVVHERSVAIGGNSVREHFHAKDNFKSMIEEVEGPETCNTYNMLKLSALLYLANGEASYADYYERALYNHILSSQHPETGGLVYFTSMRPQHYRVYSQVDQAMWCCVGSGLENHLQYGRFIYAHSEDTLFVNLFIPSRLHWKEKNVVLRQENRIPDEEYSEITIEKGGRFEMQIRIPPWLKQQATLKLNGKTLKARTENGYLKINRLWRDGDQLFIDLPMQTRLEQLPDGSAYYAVLHGPVVLSAPIEKKDETLTFFADDKRMGHVAAGQQCALTDAPMFISDSPDIINKIIRVPGEELRFVAPGLIGNTRQSLQLIPFFRVHDSRYMLYWQMGTQKELEALRAEHEKSELMRLALDARTVDRVNPGEQQPEADHGFKGEDTEAGVNHGRHWRHARGWFSYRLSNPQHKATTLRLTLIGTDRGRTFKVLLNGLEIDTINTNNTVNTNGTIETGFYHIEYTLPENIRNSNVIEFKLEALPGSIAGGLYELRLLE